MLCDDQSGTWEKEKIGLSDVPLDVVDDLVTS